MNLRFKIQVYPMIYRSIFAFYYRSSIICKPKDVQP